MTRHYLAELQRRAVKVLRFSGWPDEDIDFIFQTANDRTKVMAGMYREGKTLEMIGAHFGITRERVRQLLRAANVDRVEGGQRKNSETNAARAAQKRNERCMLEYGCTHLQYQMLLHIQRQSEYKSRGPMRAFQQQRVSARNRFIPFKLNLWQWWTIWQDSGKWDLRGRGKGHYCMARIGDKGTYEVGNVKIILNEENASESYEHTSSDKRKNIYRDDLGLTAHQRRIYDLAIYGLRNRDIANRLGLSQGSVASQLVAIRKVRPEIRGAA